MRKNLLFIISFFLLALLASCNIAAFDRYPGKKLDSIPEVFCGRYKAYDAKKNDTETIVVTPTSWIESGTNPKTHPLNDSTVVSVYNANYFISFRDENSPFWYVYYMKKKERRN